MKTLLILGAGKEQVAAINAARVTKGIRTLVLDFNPEADGRVLADEFHLVSTRDRDAILAFVRGYSGRIDGVMTIASDIPHMVSAAAEALGVRHIPQPVAELCVHKLHMKEKLIEADVNVPAFAQGHGRWMTFGPLSRASAFRWSSSRWTSPEPVACSA